MTIEVSVAIAVLIFAVIGATLVYTLLLLQKSLIKLDRILSETERRIHTVDPALNALSEIGEVIEKKAKKVKREYEVKQAYEELVKESRQEESTVKNGLVGDVADWVIVSLRLGEKLLNRR